MIQMAHRRRKRTIIAVGLFLILAAIAFFVIWRVFSDSRLLITGLLLLFCGEIMFFSLIWYGTRRHQIKNGNEYARLHYCIEKAVYQALYDAGIYVERDVLLKKCALLPKLDICINDTITSGTIRIENRIKHDHRLEELPISSALPIEFVLTSSYLSDDGNNYIYDFERFNIENLVFNSYEEYHRHVKEIDTYDLFLNARHILPMHHIILIGQTGSGKSYALYALILQMLMKLTPWELYIIDPKRSGLYVLGCSVCKDHTACTIEEGREVLQAFYKRMQERKDEMKDNLMIKLDSDYRDFDLVPICLIIDEYSAFNATLSRYDKKIRDEVNEIIGNVVREGRQLGCFIIVAQQQTNSSNLPTEIKENIPCKIILGMAERQTYITAIGVYPDIARRHYDVGQGLLVFPGIGSPEIPAVTTIPTLRFDILSAAKAAYYSEQSGGDVITPAPMGEIDA